ncbi:hypothetical protein [Alkalicoccus daliensis]|uniref:Uncharacterized protein n=1 Tax=Alkalicoccus daliensis TaxID=745820 RepID=A0A1H0HWG4_9BACI|nr:hypothetical protein [Alkalicoccus daliensis]SDO23250.1 hypothetical protein SAMN04488053_10963 [Alkalicoccus daliensis]
MFWIFMMLGATFTFIIAITAINADAKQKMNKSELGKEAAKKNGVKTKHGKYDIKIWKVSNPYPDLCFRTEFSQKGKLVHKDIAYFDNEESYTDVMKYFVKEFDKKKKEESSMEDRASLNQFELEAWDGDVYEEDTVELPKQK